MNTFRRWVCRLRQDKKPSADSRTKVNRTFIEVPIANAAQASGAGCVIEVSLGRGIRVKLEGEAGLRALGLVLGHFEQAVQSELGATRLRVHAAGRHAQIDRCAG
jgi:hypothetical protein